MDTEARERFERTERNLEELTGIVKDLAQSQARTQEALNALLDALFTQRGNGHSKQPLPPQE